jgi:(R,R)-butanediol dehydrogenase/meso-butanediol dehydrogenase/diacetyl reductase
MLALRWHARGDVRLDEIPPPPPPGPGELQLRVLWCGICGTDVEEYRHGPLFVPVDQPNPATGRQAPLVLGHEFSGEVIALGAGASRFAEGQRVAVDTLIWCGRCFWCLRHQVSLCERLAAVGLMADGGLAEFCNVPETTCLPVSDNLSDEAAALAETLAVGVRALRRGRLTVGDRIAVVGGGPVGLMALQAALASGAASATLIEPRADRRDIGAAVGASRVVCPEASPEVFADLVIECSGNANAVHTALTAARKGGRVVLVGLYSRPTTVPFLDIVTTEKEMLGSFSHVYDEDFASALALLGRGTVQTEPIISDRVALHDALEHGLLALEREPEAHLKILVSARAGT